VLTAPDAQFSGRTFETFVEIEKAKDWLAEQAEQSLR
jgi:hypothetical protein